jgi:type I restriction enzyme S subunit
MSEWRPGLLGELCSFKGGNAFPQDQQGHSHGSAPFIKVSDLSGARNASSIVAANNWVDEAQIKALKLSLFPAGSSVFAKIGEGMKSERVRQLTVPTAIDNNLMAAVPNPMTDARFLFYLLQTVRLASHAVGSALPYLRQSTLQQVPVLVPTIVEQQAIAEVLGALDDKIAANANLARSLYSLVELEFDRSTRQAIRVAELADLVATQYGLTTSGASKRENLGLLRVTDINKEPWIEWANVPGCEVSGADRAKYLLHESDIVVARMADPGKCGWIAAGDPETVFASYLVRLRVHEADHSPYVFQFLRSSTYQRYADAVGQGSVQKNMNAKAMVAIQIALPSAEVLAKFARRFRDTWGTMSLALRENRTLAATRDALLPQLMSGKLRVRDAERIAEEAGV